NSSLVVDTLINLGELLDETGDRRAGIEQLRQALRIVDQVAPGMLEGRTCLRDLAAMLLESNEPGAREEVQRLLKRRDGLEERLRSAPLDPGAGREIPGQKQPALPEVRFLPPAENSIVKGSEVEVRVAFLSPLPLARYRYWVNGRPFGGEKGIDLPLPDE